jgi:DUF1365 family protein
VLPLRSCLFEGRLTHRRYTPPRRSFRYSLFMVYLDLSELDRVFARRWLWSASSPNLAWFRRADHYGDPRAPLDESIRALVEDRTGERPAGPIRLLTHLRYLGHCFNPVSFYYCFARDGRTLETVVAEVDNTPWNERHMYVLPERDNLGHATSKRYELRKAFHVSPFFEMDLDYRWRFGTPPEAVGKRLWVRMESFRKSDKVFDATLAVERRPLSGPELARSLVRRPAMTMQVLSAIYGQALRLFLRGAPFHPHPRTAMSRRP